MKIKHLLALLLCCAGLPAFAQNDDVAAAQHTILGQKFSPDRCIGIDPKYASGCTMVSGKDGFGLFIHFGLAAVHGGIDLSWGMYANKPWEDGEITPADYWKLADRWNPEHFNAEKIVSKAKKSRF